MDAQPEALWKVIAEFTRENSVRDVKVAEVATALAGARATIDELKASAAAIADDREHEGERLLAIERRIDALDAGVSQVLKHYEKRKEDTRMLINEGVKYALILSLAGIGSFSLQPIFDFLHHLVTTGHP